MSDPLPCLLGADQGLKGAIAAYHPESRALQIFRMPVDPKDKNAIDCQALAALIQVVSQHVRHAFVEKVNGFPGQAGQFSFGWNAGVLVQSLHCNHVPVTLVPASRWKPGIGLRRLPHQSKKDAKTEARALAAALFPECAHEFQRVGDDGAAEAALIAYYGSHIILPMSMTA